MARAGPLSHKRAYDLLIQAESGTCAVTGEAGAPAKPGPPVADITTGLQSALSVVALLYSRDTGRSADGNTGRRGGGNTGRRGRQHGGGARQQRRRQPVRHHDGRDGLPAHLHPALGYRSAAAGHELAGCCAVRVVSHRRRPDSGAWHDQRPRMAAPGTRNSAAHRLGRRRAVPNERRPGGEPDGARRRRSAIGAGNTTSITCRRRRMPRESGTPGTTCPARFSCTHS